MREIKFRAWDGKQFWYWGIGDINGDGSTCSFPSGTIAQQPQMQYIGLKDKNGLTCIYEGDIIDDLGNIKGNIYEVDARETDTVIQGFGTKTWCETYRRAILLGCVDSE